MRMSRVNSRTTTCRVDDTDPAYDARLFRTTGSPAPCHAPRRRRRVPRPLRRQSRRIRDASLCSFQFLMTMPHRFAARPVGRAIATKWSTVRRGGDAGARVGDALAVCGERGTVSGLAAAVDRKRYGPHPKRRRHRSRRSRSVATLPSSTRTSRTAWSTRLVDPSKVTVSDSGGCAAETSRSTET